MEIQHKLDGSKGIFLVEESGVILAKMTYSVASSNMIIIDHTEVSDKLAGKGTGKQLVNAAVEYARENNIKILPLCPFAKSVFEKVKEYQDVLIKSR